MVYENIHEHSQSEDGQRLIDSIKSIVGWSQSDLSDRTGMSKNAISKRVTGKVKVTEEAKVLYRLILLCKDAGRMDLVEWATLLDPALNRSQELLHASDGAARLLGIHDGPSWVESPKSEDMVRVARDHLLSASALLRVAAEEYSRAEKSLIERDRKGPINEDI